MSDGPQDWRDELIAEQQRRIAELEVENAKLRRLLREALERIAELERHLGMNSRTSSKPPSSDNEKARKKRRRRRKSGRSRGGQEGHEGHFRGLLPVEQVDHIIAHHPTHCEKCGLELSQDDAVGQPTRHQVSEVIPNPVETTEHQTFTSQCPGCGETTRASGAEVPRSGWGPRLTALVATLSAVTRDSRRQVAWIVSDVFGAPDSTGTVQNHLEEVSRALAPGFEQVRAAVAEAPVVGLDETGWCLGSLPHWVWVVESEQGVLYQIEARRKKRSPSASSGRMGDEFSRPTVTVPTTFFPATSARSVTPIFFENLRPWQPATGPSARSAQNWRR